MTFNIGDRVTYKPTGETGIVRSIPEEGRCFVVYDLLPNDATLDSHWSAKLTRWTDLNVSVIR